MEINFDLMQINILKSMEENLARLLKTINKRPKQVFFVAFCWSQVKNIESQKDCKILLDFFKEKKIVSACFFINNELCQDLHSKYKPFNPSLIQNIILSQVLFNEFSDFRKENNSIKC